jgi:hypothetical protein
MRAVLCLLRHDTGMYVTSACLSITTRACGAAGTNLAICAIGDSAAGLSSRWDLFFFGKILPLREIGFCTYLYRNSFHLSDPALSAMHVVARLIFSR